MGLQCNSVLSDYTDCPEFATVNDLLSFISPRNALDLGSGIGRASVYLRKRYGWEDTNFYLLDGNSGDEQVAGLNYSIGKNFYNSFDAAVEFCTVNGIAREKLFLIDAEKHDLGATKFDVCYSLKAIGFHWPITSYLEKLYNNLARDAYLFLELRSVNPNYYPKKRIPRMYNFVNAQLDAIDRKKYRRMGINLRDKFPILILQKI